MWINLIFWPKFNIWSQVYYYSQITFIYECVLEKCVFFMSPYNIKEEFIWKDLGIASPMLGNPFSNMEMFSKEERRLLEIMSKRQIHTEAIKSPYYWKQNHHLLEKLSISLATESIPPRVRGCVVCYYEHHSCSVFKPCVCGYWLSLSWKFRSKGISWSFVQIHVSKMESLII